MHQHEGGIDPHAVGDRRDCGASARGRRVRPLRPAEAPGTLSLCESQKHLCVRHSRRRQSVSSGRRRAASARATTPDVEMRLAGFRLPEPTQLDGSCARRLLHAQRAQSRKRRSCYDGRDSPSAMRIRATAWNWALEVSHHDDQRDQAAVAAAPIRRSRRTLPRLHCPRGAWQVPGRTLPVTGCSPEKNGLATTWAAIE